MRRVAVTGIGCISALGASVPEFWSALSSARSGIAPLQSIDPARLRFSNAAEVRDFDPARHFEPGQLELLDRFAQFALIAAREAAHDAALDWSPELRERAAVICGTSLGGALSQDAQFAELYERKRDRVHPLSIP